MSKIKAVIIGTAHMHVNEVALYISEQEDFALIGASDVAGDGERIPPLRYTPLWNLENIKKNYCQAVYGDYKQMLDDLKPDIAFILTENCQKAEAVEQCAKRGINVCIEKPLAINLREAEKIRASVLKSGITAVINWPVLWRPYIHKMMAAVSSGIVGEPIELRYINGHTGPLGKGAKHRGVSENAEEMTDAQRAKTWWHRESRGGGVFLDIACYGCFFSQWIFGKGSGVLAYGANLNTPFGDTADNFAAVIKNENFMSVIEGTWTTPRAIIPSGPVVLCREGAVICTGGAENAPDVKAFDIYGNEVKVPDISFEDKYKNMPCQYANHIKTGEPFHAMLTLDTNMEIMAALDGVIRASASGKTEKI